MRIFYHGTPTVRVSGILREGLKVGAPKYFTLGIPRGRIYLLKSLEDALYYMEPEVPEEVEPLTILKVRLPSGWPVYEEAGDYFYTSKDIPPKYIEVMEL